ncbi:MAG: ImmA/IrrE family metallo-endopeptidase [Dehalococcoidia bacterium]|nr:ImmA/IrrE family metallo-endopeptidase [Dehalococcoidia bacterium]MCK4581014.1 ImmA/IrrE family metallo-endopeptidase [Dehalococcoidia bacterium]
MPHEQATPSPLTIGRTLKQARTAMGLTLKQVSESMGSAISTLSEIESGRRRVSAVGLHRFARLYQRPLSFFLEEEQTSASFAVLMRAASTSSVSRETLVRFHELCRNYCDLRKLVGAPEIPGPPDYSSSRLATLGQAEELAEAERASMGLDGQPVGDICDLLESKRAVKIFSLPGDSEDFSGAFAYDDRMGACFLINSLHPRRRRTFTVAHEYGHCLAHRDQLALIDSRPPLESKTPRERFANAFAAAFLMPRHTISEMLGQLSFPPKSALAAGALIQLAIYFDVSFEAIGWRLVSLKKLSPSRWEEILTQQLPSSLTARVLGYGKHEEPPDPVPLQYRYLAYKAYEAELISFEKLAELLHRNYYELREELGQT